MCGRGTSGFSYNMDHINDLLRGRAHNAGGRFRKIDDYAYRRWEAARTMRAATRWLSVLKLVAQRDPFGGYHFKRTWREA